MSHQDDPLQTILAQREQQRMLCRQLEDVADRLPQKIGRSIFTEIYSKLKDDLPIYNSNEELLYSFLRTRWPKRMDFGSLISVIQAEHRIHESFADEFDEVFLENNEHGLGRGYMLRYFFETLRYHLDWEDAVVIPFARSVLRKIDLRLLASEMAAREIIMRAG